MLEQTDRGPPDGVSALSCPLGRLGQLGSTCSAPECVPLECVGQVSAYNTCVQICLMGKGLFVQVSP